MEMALKINSIHEAYELKRAIKDQLNKRQDEIMKLQREEELLRSYMLSEEIIDKTVGKAMAILKADNRTGVESIRKLNEIIGVMKCSQQ